MKHGHSHLFTFLAAIWLTFGLSDVSAQFSPDRPGFATGTHTVGVGELYLETGFGFVRKSGEINRLPELNLRTGLTARTELFLAWDGMFMNKSTRTRQYDLPDVGLKYRLFETDVLQLTALGVLAVDDTGMQAVVNPLAGIMFERELNDRSAFFGGLQYGSDTDIFSREWELNIIIGSSLEMSSRLELYTEIYNGMGTPTSLGYVVNQAGFTYVIHPRMQVDLYGGWKLSGEVPTFWGFGFAMMR